MIEIEKDNQKYIPQSVYSLKPPFIFIGGSRKLKVPEESIPFYFERITNKLNKGVVQKLNVVEHYGYNINGITVEETNEVEKCLNQ